MQIQGFENIKQYIPQREPIIMVDSITEVTELLCRTGLTITQDNIFVEKGLLQESGIIEHIAQSAAVGVGYRCKEKKEPVKLGFIAAIKDLKIVFLPKVGEQLQTTIEITNQVLNITIVQGKVLLNNESIAQCEMRIFLNE